MNGPIGSFVQAKGRESVAGRLARADPWLSRPRNSVTSHWRRRITFMQLVSWNIRAGGGIRALDIADQIHRWSAELVGLSEFRGTVPSRSIASLLGEVGLSHRESTADPLLPNRNSLLLAARWPLKRITLRSGPTEPGRWLAVEVQAPEPFVVGLMHAPNMVTGRKMPYLKAIEHLARTWRRGPAVFMGDTNCGWPGLDEERPVFNCETEHWLNSLSSLGWQDAYRLLFPEERCYTWFSPNGGNGFRLDQAFVNRALRPRLTSARYAWGSRVYGETRRDALSDHAALLLNLH